MCVLTAAFSVAVAVAAPPGPIDGEAIPTNFGVGNLAATQSNFTGFGDRTVFPGAVVEGNETDQLFLAKSALNDKLHVGITGNLATNGNIWLIGIGVPNRVGQTENRAEGLGFCPDNGPPWTVRSSAREIVISDNGTPEITSDDTYSDGVNGMIFPAETDYAYAVDVFAGNISINRYILHEVDGVGIGTWDPTPDNLGDAMAPVYAAKDNVASGPTNDGDDILTSAFGVDEGGFDNSNLLGITGTDASGAATATTGLELGIPFTELLTDLGALDGTETIELYVLMIDGVESSCVGDAYGHVVNQVLPPLSPGGVCDSPADLIGFRPDLTTLMGVVSVDLNTIPAFTGIAEGVIDPAEYGGAAVATQTCPTPYSDQAFDPSLFSRTAGSELDALYVTNDGTNLYLGITGNIEENGNRVTIFFDNTVDAGGETFLSWDPMDEDTPGDGGAGLEGDALPPLASDINTRALFDYAISINASAPPNGSVYVDLWDIVAQVKTFKGFSILESGSGELDSVTQGGSNQWSMQVALHNLNDLGVLGSGSIGDDILTVETAAGTATTGFELAIPLADIGINPCDGPATIHMWSLVTGRTGWRSNQSLPTMRPLPPFDTQRDNPENVVTDWYAVSDDTCIFAPNLCFRAAAHTYITTPGAIVNDCNNNQIEDMCEILDGSVNDANFNGVPDTCDGGEACPLGTAAECADVDGNNITDSVCRWWDCSVDVCVEIPKGVPSDLGGAFGACPADAFCNIHDRNHALTCFAGLNSCATINIDAGGAFGACLVDGFCNIHDANHALSCFAGTNLCTCPPSPAPETGPRVVGQASLRAVSTSRSALPGELVQVQILVDNPLDALQSYQLHTVASGGRRGQLELVDIEVDDRMDFVFAGFLSTFDAFNVAKGQMLSGLDFDHVATADDAYLATFTYRASPDAVGTFVVDILHDESAGDQTFLVGANSRDKIEVTKTNPAVIVVSSGPARSIR